MPELPPSAPRAARPRRAASAVRVPERGTRRLARDVGGPHSRGTAGGDRLHRGKGPWQADRRAEARRCTLAGCRERSSQPSRLTTASDPAQDNSGIYLGALPVCSGNIPKAKLTNSVITTASSLKCSTADAVGFYNRWRLP